MNRYDRKKITQNKMKKLHENEKSYFVSEKESANGEVYYQPLHLSGCRKYAKKRTNRIIRKSRNDFSNRGCAYRKKFDYWWTLF